MTAEKRREAARWAAQARWSKDFRTDDLTSRLKAALFQNRLEWDRFLHLKKSLALNVAKGADVVTQYRILLERVADRGQIETKFSRSRP
jgi:hypothetical protein